MVYTYSDILFIFERKEILSYVPFVESLSHSFFYTCVCVRVCVHHFSLRASNPNRQDFRFNQFDSFPQLGSRWGDINQSPEMYSLLDCYQEAFLWLHYSCLSVALENTESSPKVSQKRLPLRCLVMQCETCLDLEGSCYSSERALIPACIVALA